MRILQPPTNESMQEVARLAVARAMEKGCARYQHEVELRRDVDIQEIKRQLRRLSPMTLRALVEAVRQLPSRSRDRAGGNRPHLKGA